MQSLLYEAYRESTEASKNFLLLIIISPVPFSILIPHPQRASTFRVSQCQNKMRSQK